MRVALHLEREGREITGSFTEVADDENGLVVRHLKSREEGGTYRTPFKHAFLEIQTEIQTKYNPNLLDDARTADVIHTIITVRMAKSPTLSGDQTKWAVPRDQLDEALELARRAVEFFLRNVSSPNPTGDRHTVVVGFSRHSHLQISAPYVESASGAK